MFVLKHLRDKQMRKQINKEDDVTAPAEIIETPEGISVKEAGRRGGKSTLEHQGVEFFREIGRKGGRKTFELYHDLLAEFGRKGGRPRCPVLEGGTGEEFPEKKEADAVGPRDSPPA